MQGMCNERVPPFSVSPAELSKDPLMHMGKGRSYERAGWGGGAMSPAIGDTTQDPSTVYFQSRFHDQISGPRCHDCCLNMWFFQGLGSGVHVKEERRNVEARIRGAVGTLVGCWLAGPVLLNACDETSCT